MIILGIRWYMHRHQPPYVVSYQQILDVIPQGNIILLKVQGLSGRIKSILFRLVNPAQMPALLAEMPQR